MASNDARPVDLFPAVSYDHSFDVAYKLVVRGECPRCGGPLDQARCGSCIFTVIAAEGWNRDRGAPQRQIVIHTARSEYVWTERRWHAGIVMEAVGELYGVRGDQKRDRIPTCPVDGDLTDKEIGGDGNTCAYCGGPVEWRQ
jgi:hypothetical protein